MTLLSFSAIIFVVLLALLVVFSLVVVVKVGPHLRDHNGNEVEDNDTVVASAEKDPGLFFFVRLLPPLVFLSFGALLVILFALIFGI